MLTPTVTVRSTELIRRYGNPRLPGARNLSVLSCSPWPAVRRYTPGDPLSGYAEITAAPLVVRGFRRDSDPGERPSGLPCPGSGCLAPGFKSIVIRGLVSTVGTTGGSPVHRTCRSPGHSVGSWSTRGFGSRYSVLSLALTSADSDEHRAENHQQQTTEQNVHDVRTRGSQETLLGLIRLLCVSSANTGRR